MEQITPVLPVAPTPPGASERPAGGTAGGAPDAPASLLGPFLLGAACGWILLSIRNLGQLFAVFSFELARAGWLPYLQPALLLAVTGTLAIRSVWRKRVPRGERVGMRLALFIAWAPYLSQFVLPRSIFQPTVPRDIGGPATLSALQLALSATLFAVAWLTGGIAVFVWGDPRGQLSRTANIRGRAIVSRWLIFALVASVAFALIALLPTIITELFQIILVLPIDRTCGGACTPGFVLNHLAVPLLLSIALGVLGGVVGGVLRFGPASLRGLNVQQEAALTDEEEAAARSSSASGEASTPAALVYPRSLPGSRYWGSFLLGALGCASWLFALFLSGIPSLSAPMWRDPAQPALLLALPIGVVVYAGLHLRRDDRVPPVQTVYALLVVIAGLLASLLEVLLRTGSNAGTTVFVPILSSLVLPLFGPALSLGVAIGFAWGTRRPDVRFSAVRLGGVGAVLCGWAGFALPLIGFMVSLIVAFYTHSIVCGGLGGCMLAAAILFAFFETAATVALFGLPLMLFGLAIGRRLRLAALRQMELSVQ